MSSPSGCNEECALYKYNKNVLDSYNQTKILLANNCLNLYYRHFSVGYGTLNHGTTHSQALQVAGGSAPHPFPLTRPAPHSPLRPPVSDHNSATAHPGSTHPCSHATPTRPPACTTTHPFTQRPSLYRNVFDSIYVTWFLCKRRVKAKCICAFRVRKRVNYMAFYRLLISFPMH